MKLFGLSAAIKNFLLFKFPRSKPHGSWIPMPIVHALVISALAILLALQKAFGKCLAMAGYCFCNQAPFVAYLIPGYCSICPNRLESKDFLVVLAFRMVDNVLISFPAKNGLMTSALFGSSAISLCLWLTSSMTKASLSPVLMP